MFLCEFIGNDEGKFREYIKHRGYKNGRTVQVREIKILDFAVPREIEEEFLKDMAAQNIYMEGEFGNHPKIEKAVRWISKIFGIEQVPFKYTPDQPRHALTKTKFMMIGKLADHIDERGVELY